MGMTLCENLERLVEVTNNIHPTGKRFEPDARQIKCIMKSVEHARKFLKYLLYC